MTSIKISVSSKSVAKPETVIAVGLFPTAKTDTSNAFTASQLESLGASFKAEATTRTLNVSGQSYLILGLGTEHPSNQQWRELGGAIARALKSVDEVELQLPVEDISQAEALLEGIAIGHYSYQPNKSKKFAVHLVSELAVDKSSLKRISAIAAAVHHTRRLATTPANVLYPQSFAAEAAETTKDLGITCTIWDEKELKKDGFGLIAAVGMGSVRPPRLVKLVYEPKGATRHLALVGKGITFDTGGLAVKPLTGMLGMKYDMAGAATVYSAIEAIATLKLPIKVSAYLCLAENMPSGSAARPGDVFTARNGKTVEITNPDAEGRLVLADGLSLASEEHPDLIVDVATLTGAARIALGVRYTGLMGSATGTAALEQAAADCGELVWTMPLPAELHKSIESRVADLRNSKVGSSFGGMLVGGHFISEFIGNKKDGSKLEWAHLDIAGPADNESKPYGYTPTGPTGVMVRTLVTLAEGMSA